MGTEDGLRQQRNEPKCKHIGKHFSLINQWGLSKKTIAKDTYAITAHLRAIKTIPGEAL